MCLNDLGRASTGFLTKLVCNIRWQCLARQVGSMHYGAQQLLFVLVIAYIKLPSWPLFQPLDDLLMYTHVRRHDSLV